MPSERSSIGLVESFWLCTCTLEPSCTFGTFPALQGECAEEKEKDEAKEKAKEKEEKKDNAKDKIKANKAEDPKEKDPEKGEKKHLQAASGAESGPRAQVAGCVGT